MIRLSVLRCSCGPDFQNESHIIEGLYSKNIFCLSWPLPFAFSLSRLWVRSVKHSYKYNIRYRFYRFTSSSITKPSDFTSLVWCWETRKWNDNCLAWTGIVGTTRQRGLGCQFHLLFGPFPNNRIDFFIASTRTWLGSVMQMGRRRLRRDINFPSALLQAKWILRVEKQCKKQIDSYNR